MRIVLAAILAGFTAPAAGQLPQPALTQPEVTICFMLDQQLGRYSRAIETARQRLAEVRATDSLTIEQDSIAAVTRVNTFVDSYNEVAATFNRDCRGRSTTADNLRAVCETEHFGRPLPVSAYCDSFRPPKPRGLPGPVADHPGVPGELMPTLDTGGWPLVATIPQ